MHRARLENRFALQPVRHRLPTPYGVAAFAVVSLCMAIAHAVASPEVSWPKALFNPRPLPDDVILPLPCGGAMAFRAVPTPKGTQRYAVTGPFVRADNTSYLLMGKYEVTRLQVQAVMVPPEGGHCPTPDEIATIPQLAVWSEAVDFADRYSSWLTANAEDIAECSEGNVACLPRVDRYRAYLRLPLETESTLR